MPENKDRFRIRLEALINENSMENGSNTPDYILAKYLVNCLDNWDEAKKKLDEHYTFVGNKNTYISKEEIEKAKSELDEKTFRQEYLGEFVTEDN